MIEVDIKMPDMKNIVPPGTPTRKSGKSKEFLYLVVLKLRSIRDNRIRAGQRVDGSPLLDGGVDRYSPEYEADKMKIGRRVYTGPDRYIGLGGVLGAGGHMLGSQHIEVNAVEAALMFGVDAAGKAYGNEMRRPGSLVPFSRKEIDEAVRQATLELERRGNAGK